MKKCGLIPILVGLVLFGVRVAPGQTVPDAVLTDMEGFEGAPYPLGDLGSLTDGNSTWSPATHPAQIVAVGGAHGQVLRRSQTGSDNTDYLNFPSVTNGLLTIKFDARASSLTRTLDIVLMPVSGATMSSMIGWGTVTNKICYYDGAAWIPVFNLDTNWHAIEIANHVGGTSNYFELKIDGTNVGTGLPWRNTFAAGTAFGKLRIGGIRGTVGDYGDIDNLVITGTPPDLQPPDSENPIQLFAPQKNGGQFGFSFQTQTNRDYLVEHAGVLNPFAWRPLDWLTGDGSIQRYLHPLSNTVPQFYRISRVPILETNRNDGYRGIWFTLGQFSTYGDKYSGGLGTYTANHVPTAIYAPEVDKTFFVYGGTIKDQRHLLIMASYYDHATGQVPRPTVVLDKGGVNDPHDNASICIDPQGYIWVFVSGRATARPGFKYRSKAPYNVSAFDFIRQDEMTYPQPWYMPGFGFFHLFTKYTNGRELYWETSPNGTNWSPHQKLAGIGGHYQVNCTFSNKIGTFFNRHPGGDVDKRTDLYYMQTTNYGTTWTTVNGTPLTVPLTTTNNPALVINYSAQGKLMYGMDLTFDANGFPVMLYLTSFGPEPGPQNNPRQWLVTRWDGAQWITAPVCLSDHNYDMGSIYLQGTNWFIIGPTQDGPQLYQAGGEMALWQSQDKGLTWKMVRQITKNSIYNHSYARRPRNAKDPFFTYWADGDPTTLTPSHLYFGNSDGTHVWQLPYDSNAVFNTPQEINY